MGEVVGAVICEGLGTVRPLEGWREPPAGEGQVEYLYAYRPDLFPRPSALTDMWRYLDLLPIGDREVRYPLRVGATPLIAPPELRRTLGLPRLHLKDETWGPTGSNKDRATALVLEHALRTGASTVTCASTGNVATSLAVGAAAAGLRAVVFVPEDVDPAKLRLMLLAGADVLRVREGYEAAFRLSREAARAFGWLDRNTGVNPMTVEAKKTVAFEIFEQLGRAVPDVVLAPVGDGPTLAALAKGFRELAECGVADRMPRVVGVQAEGCQPVRRAFREGRPVAVVEPRTLADGIAVGAPVSAPAVLRAVRESGGGLVAVADDELLSAIRALAAGAGVLAEPAGAAAFAGLWPARAEELLSPDETVVALVTGSGLKTPQFLEPARAAHTVSADLDQVARAVGP